jgi:hypothetical protein
MQPHAPEIHTHFRGRYSDAEELCGNKRGDEMPDWIADLVNISRFMSVW